MTPTNDQIREVIGGDIPDKTIERLRAVCGLSSTPCSPKIIHHRATFSAAVSFDRAESIFRFLVGQGFSVTAEQPESRRGNWRIEGEKIEAMNVERSDSTNE